MAKRIKVTFWYKRERLSYIFNLNKVMLDELLICLEKQYPNKQLCPKCGMLYWKKHNCRKKDLTKCEKKK